MSGSNLPELPATEPPAAPVGPAVEAATASDRPPAAPGRAPFLADLPFDAPDELEGWLLAIGGGVGILGFLLPWRSSLEAGLPGYLGSWGLGISANLPIFVLVVVVAALAVLPNRVAAWVRTGVGGMVVGGLLLGLTWLYLGGGATEIGAILAAVGGVLLIAGGILAVAPARTGRPPEDA
ncbi:MAG TPA: transposase [Candidatus Sulfomarinibacteraceae bacterium]|nr:transposase [Candidatus Sulfomarinibacteraceae bacterium]